MVGEEHVDEVALLFELGELAHPPEVRGPLHVEVLLRRTTEHERENDLHEEVGLEVRLGRNRLSEPIPAEPYLQTDLFVKVVLSLMLGRPAEEYLDVQRAAHLQRMRELTDLKRQGNLVDVLLADHGLFHLEADLRWIDLTAARLTALAEEVAS